MALSQLTLEAIRMRLAGNTGLTTASGSVVTTTGNMSAGSNALTVVSGTTFSVGHGIKVAGAGTGGSSLLTWVTAKDGNSLTLKDMAITAVTGAVVSHDDRAVVPAIRILPSSGNYPAYFPAIAIKVEGSTGFNFPNTQSGYCWFYIYVKSTGDAGGQPVTILNMITDRLFELLHCQEDNMSNVAVRFGMMKEMYRSGIIPESEISEYVHSQAVRYNFMARTN